MATKNVTEVLIGGKIYTLSGYESEEYLQRVAGYLNNKITEMKSVSGYQRMSPDMRSLMLNLNVADDYFKLKKQADQLNDQIAQKDKELYEIKHELIQTQMKLESMTASLANYHDAQQPSALWEENTEEQETAEASAAEEDVYPAEEEPVPEASEEEQETEEDSAEIKTPESVLTPPVISSSRGIPAPPNYTGSRRKSSGKNRGRR